MLSNWWHDKRLPKQTIASRKFKKHKTLMMGHTSIPARCMSSDQTTGVCWSMILLSEFANQHDQIWTRKATKKGMQQCECQQIFFCLWEPTDLFIEMPTPMIFNCSTVLASSLELITCSFHKLTSKVLASFNNYHCAPSPACLRPALKIATFSLEPSWQCQNSPQTEQSLRLSHKFRGEFQKVL